jgi:hypothetical protein
MPEFCHRCGGELSPLAGDGRPPFCPHCGAPQLLLSEYTEPLSTAASSDAFAGPTAGTLPPPRPNHVDWKMALGSAAIVGAVAAVLSAISARSPNLSPISTIWIISASLTTLAIYQRRRPLASMNAGVGAKIGMLVGIVLATFLGAMLSVGLVIARYGLHSLSGFDADMAQAMKAQVQQLAASRPVPPESLALINSLQFRTTMMLTGVGLVLFFVLLISIFGGAVGGMLRTRRLGTKA